MRRSKIPEADAWDFGRSKVSSPGRVTICKVP